MQLARQLVQLAMLVAAVMAMVGGAGLWCASGLLTNDATVQAAVRPLAAPLAIGVLLYAPVAVGEGVLLAQRQLRFLAGVYLASAAC